jgi:DNA polymerase-3 subunit epsilon
LDAEILADVYLVMTGGQVDLGFKGESEKGGGDKTTKIRRLSKDRVPLKVIRATACELEQHQQILRKIQGDGENSQW